jgi:beta-phosphoglucomutase-like phosphatase (HAD superfamily)
MSRTPSLPPAPAALIFDLDGTLVDTVETRIRAWLAVFEEFGIPATRAQVAMLIGIDGKRLARDVASAAGRDLPDGGDEQIDHRCGEIYEGLNRDPQPLPGARDLLVWLDERRLDWAIATSSRRDQVATSLAALELPRSPAVIDGSLVEHAKPAPDLLLLAARELDQRPEACWCVGDSTWDVRAALAAGMTPIGITAGAAVSDADLADAGAVLVSQSLVELHAALQRAAVTSG